MIELTALTKPGPFSKRTHELGTYLGIRRDGKLVAMAGERLKVPGYTEVSAVCTHPEHTGHGYARILMAEVMRRILRARRNAVLHVRERQRARDSSCTRGWDSGRRVLCTWRCFGRSRS
jgi:predicted GNAT family acetyltransferase